jgi:tRNA uridine 5-carboxymethylaminomethyl modification enzyme
MEALTAGRAALDSLVLSPTEASARGLRVNPDGVRRSGFALLSFPDIGFDDLLRIAPDLGEIPAPIRAQLERDATYAVYLDRQKADAEALRRDERQAIPAEFPYAEISGLSRELCGKLERTRPATLAQAARIDGMTPAALTLILARLKHQARSRSA